MPKKTFSVGELLTSTDVNTYLMNQTVMTFASSTARTTAIPSPTEGMTTYLQDTDELQFYNGSSWLTAVVTNDDESITTLGKFIANRAAGTSGSSAGGIDFRIDGNTWGQIFMNSTSDMYVAANTVRFSGTPRYINAPSVYSWHSGNEQIGTQMVIGAWAVQNNLTFSAANTWQTIGSVNITVPTGANIIKMNYNFTMYTAASGMYLVRVYYNGGATSVSDFTQFQNVPSSHFQVAGVRGIGVTAGSSGTIFLQVYGTAITLIGDANDSGYFTVSTI